MYSVPICGHNRYTATNCCVQTVALYRVWTVYEAGRGSFPAGARRDKDLILAPTSIQTLRIIKAPESFSLLKVAGE
jgi:hypothetical protein